MNYYFSPKKNAFYPKSLESAYIKAGTLPDDLIDIHEMDFIEFSSVPPVGKTRGVARDGLPCWIDLPVSEVSVEGLKAQARKLRDNFILSTDRMLLEDYTINDTVLSDEQRDELLKVRANFKTWPSQQNWPNIEFPEIPLWILIEAVNNGYVTSDWPN
jgi:hypothetical protein